MNERLKELLEQASEVHDYWYRGESQRLVDHKMFAELIIQECIDIIRPYTVRMSRPGEEYLHPIQEIKKHFGVK